ncbi:hypothetical protein [Vreelandella azerica]|uniref:hypothetical protein n=1 Tax=Vreelandella azerica TaxID=2732867 RepID=UPI001F416610|nr:hypothetical protein [Halomonas azerica]
MDNSLVIALAACSVLLGLAAVAVLIVMATRGSSDKDEQHSQDALDTQTTKSGAIDSPSETETGGSNKTRAKGKQHSLFVIFAHPDEATDQRLTEWLEDKQARFDPIKKVFHIDGVQPSNPITIANAFPPGRCLICYAARCISLSAGSACWSSRRCTKGATSR